MISLVSCGKAASTSSEKKGTSQQDVVREKDAMVSENENSVKTNDNQASTENTAKDTIIKDETFIYTLRDDNTYSVKMNPDSNPQEIIIPESHDGIIINEIEKDAFRGCETVKKVSIPSTIEIINKGAFWGCDYLEEMYYDAASCKDFDEKDNTALFAGEKSPSLSLYIGPHVKRIPNYAFELNAPTKDFYFSSYKGGQGSLITSVVFDENSICEEIGDKAFGYNTKLKKIVLPDSIKRIGSGAFIECEILQSVTLPKALESMGDEVFYDCYLLNDIVLPDTLTEIPASAFYQCDALSNIIIPKGITAIGDRAFYLCEGFTSIIIPENVQSLGKESFRECNHLKSVNINAPITEIPQGCFVFCENLTSINIPNTVTQIGEMAFKRNAITSITIPKSVNIIEENAFIECDKLAKVKFEAPDGWLLISKNSKSGIPKETLSNQSSAAEALVDKAYAKWERFGID